jgi:multiple sugar transport system substrate-binding protein
VIALFILVAACGEAPAPIPESSPAVPTITGTPPTDASTSTGTSTPGPLETTPEIPQETPPSLGIDPQELQGITVTFWHPWSGEAGEAIRASVQAFNETNEYGIQAVEVYQGSYNSLHAKIDEAISAGSTPDLVVTYLDRLLSWQGEWIDLGLYVNDRDWGLAPEDRADFFEVFWEQDIVDGRRAGIPAQRSAQLLYYNLSWARELGYNSPPQTPAQLKEQACAATQANLDDDDPDNNRTGGWIVNTTPQSMLSWLFAFGSEIGLPDGSGYYFDSPQSAAALEFLKDLFDSGCAWRVRRGDTGEGIGEGEFVEAEFASRLALLVTGSLGDLSHQASAMEMAGNNDEWTVIAFPSPENRPAIYIYGPSFAVFRSSPAEQLASWLLARWLVSPAEQARFIRASGTFPTRAAAAGHLNDYADGHPQWAASLDLLPFARAEPRYASWQVVRWVIGDVGTQVFRSYFTADRIPVTLELMEETAAELHSRYP